MGRHFLYILTIICLTFSYGVRHILGQQSEAVAGNSFANNSSENGDGQSTTKGDVPTAEQILSNLLGMKPKNPGQTQEVQSAQIVQTAPQTLALPGGTQLSTSLARSPIKSQQTIFNNVPLVPTRALPTPQTEENQETLQPSRHYGRRRRPSKDRYDDDEDDDDDRGDERDDDDDDHIPADDDDHNSRRFDHRRGHRRWRGNRYGRNNGQYGRREGGCGCVCWKGIKPHVEWVRVPVCYHPCGVCCPKHEEQPSCACICHPCCHQCCCCHNCCHCCHSPCCHCGCRRNQIRWNPPLAPSKSGPRKIHKQTKKKTKKA